MKSYSGAWIMLLICGTLWAQQSAETLVREGMRLFTQGKIAESIEKFDAAAKADAEVEPHLWQRGISYYYVQRFADGKKQFEIHRRVNPHDVENAAWHFLCTARAEGIDAARKQLIPIQTEMDTRVPMKQVFELFAGTGSTENVLKAAEAQNGTGRADAVFFAHLYLGLYHEAAGEMAKAREHIRRAATEFARDHYMGAVAKIHWKLAQAAER